MGLTVAIGRAIALVAKNRKFVSGLAIALAVGSELASGSFLWVSSHVELCSSERYMV